MTYLNIQIAIGGHGVSRVTAVGKTGEDRSEALDFIRRITPALEELDRQAKETPRP